MASKPLVKGSSGEEGKKEEGRREEGRKEEGREGSLSKSRSSSVSSLDQVIPTPPPPPVPGQNL